VVEVGWMVDADKAGFIYEAPRQYQRNAPKPASTKAVGFCRAVLDYEARNLRGALPFDLHLRLARDAEGNSSAAVSAAERKHVESAIRQPADRRLQPKRMARAEQAGAADHDALSLRRGRAVWMQPAAAVLPLPPAAAAGLMIGGRFPIHDWPRVLSWAFEWHRPRRDLILTRGEPGSAPASRSRTPSRQVALVDAEMTRS